jgi:O-antigen ligase
MSTGEQMRRVADTAWPYVPPVFLGLCLLLGGASVRGLPQNALLQLLALAILVAALFLGRPLAIAPKYRRGAIWFGAMLTTLLLLQFVPLPPFLWTMLPGRAAIVETERLAGVVPGWMPLSVSPSATLAGALKFLPPAAILVSLLTQVSSRAMLISVRGVLIFALASILLGVLQLGQAYPQLYFYAITNNHAAVGFFSNSNHLATLMLVSLALMAGVWASAPARPRSKITRHLPYALGAAFLVLSVAIVHSIAGIGLLAFVVPGVALAVCGVLLPVRATWVTALGALSLCLAVTGFAYWGFIHVAGDIAGPYDRVTLFHGTVALAKTYFPFGSGLGTFSETYPLGESADLVTRVFANHAHNDAAELLSTTGLPGALLLLVFLFGWMWRVVDVWSRESDADAYARAASIATGVMMLHSMVDYPLRTAAGAGLFVLGLAILFHARDWRAGEAQPR